MAQFDSKFQELQAKVTAVLQMLKTKYPEAAAEAKYIILNYEDYAVEQETIQADEARGNAIAALITDAGQLLADIPDLEVIVSEPVSEPVSELLDPLLEVQPELE